MVLARLLTRLVNADDGIAAIEFGLILPALAVGFLGMVEITALYSAQSRVTWAAQSIADNIARYGNAYGNTLKKSQLQAMGQGAVAILSPSDSGSNQASTNLYLGAVMLVRNPANTNQVIAQSTWSATSPALVQGYKGAQAPTLSTGELTTAYSNALTLTDTSGGVVYVAVRYQYTSVFSLFFSNSTLRSDAYARQRWGVNVLFDAAH